ncbi:MAG: hypothetical protein EOP47_07510 [Sphingobacteriaceae bacterium]|nr:MAG: hypothetical protein EOP47_07510 [Sphingobacteriaceae bacterium]
MKFYYILLLLAAGASPAIAQHIHNDTTKQQPMEIDHMHHMDDTKPMMMHSKFSLDVPMNRDGSGTSWVPDETPIYAYMIHGKKWMTMFHGSFFMRYNNQDIFKSGTKGGSQFDIPNWLMAMAQRQVGKNGLFSVSTMFSLDPFLVGNSGYPLLYQTGETYQGSKLVNHQHPHDLFAQLSVAYTHRVAKNTDLSLSVGYPGEPALGPSVFMHRLSAMNDPNAPLSHHYQDATHIAFGVVTTGFRYKNMKLEGSIFTGREPDEFRYNFDKMRFDSYSLRLSYNPSRQWALQVSNGWLKDPEGDNHHGKVSRFTASAMHTKMLNARSFIATTLVYGQNHYKGGKTMPSVLLENTLQLNKTAIYGRYEFVQKDADELDMDGLYPTNPNFNINALTLGVNRILATLNKTNLSAGIQGTLNVSPSALKNTYGNTPVGFQVYVRVNPGILR